MKEDALKLKNLIKDPKHVVITTHHGPDGDAMGSSLAMFNFLKKFGHNVTVITPNKYAEFLHWIAGNNEVIIYEGNETQVQSITSKANLFFLLDFNNIGRIGDLGNLITSSKATKVLIDHHQNPDTSMADIVFSSL